MGWNTVCNDRSAKVMRTNFSRRWAVSSSWRSRTLGETSAGKSGRDGRIRRAPPAGPGAAGNSGGLPTDPLRFDARDYLAARPMKMSRCPAGAMA